MKVKYPFAIKVLNDALSREKRYLKLFKRPTEHKEWQERNIESCEHRIEELKITIEHLKKI